MSNMVKVKRIFAVAVVVGTMLVPSVALAQSSSDESYAGPNNIVQGLEQGGGNGPSGPTAAPAGTSNETPSSSSSGSSLPFTGADLGVLAAAGGLLLGLGFGLRRLTHRPHAA